MKARWLFLVLALVLAGCPLSYYLSVIEVKYTSKGVCSGVELTTSNPEIIEITYMGRPDSVKLTPNQPVRIPDPDPPNPEPRQTGYIIFFNGPVRSPIEVDLTWRCLPDREPLRMRFTHYDSQIRKILLITERADSTYGFDTEWVDSRP